YRANEGYTGFTLLNRIQRARARVLSFFGKSCTILLIRSLFPHASARFGSISSANEDWAPFCNRNIAANAIIAALSVHNQGSATRNSIPFFSHVARKSSRNARLWLTPPLNVSVCELVCLIARKLFSLNASIS